MFRRLKKKFTVKTKSDDFPNLSQCAETNSGCLPPSDVRGTMDTLPDDLVIHIMKFLPSKDISRNRGLSNRFDNLVNTHRLLEHNLITITEVETTEEFSDRIVLTFEKFWRKGCNRAVFIGTDDVQKYDSSLGLVPFALGEHPVVDRFYKAEAPRGGEDFLRQILPLSTINVFTCWSFGRSMSIPNSEFRTRFFDIVCETRCTIEYFDIRFLQFCDRAIDIIRSSQFKSLQNMHVSIQYIPTYRSELISSNEWDRTQELASMSNLCFTELSFKDLLLLIQHIIESWLAGKLKHPFFMYCTTKEDERFGSSGEIMKTYFHRSDIYFDGIYLHDFRRMERISHLETRDLPRCFRVVRKLDKKFLQFNRLKSGIGKFSVSFS